MLSENVRYPPKILIENALPLLGVKTGTLLRNVVKTKTCNFTNQLEEAKVETDRDTINIILDFNGTLAGTQTPI